MCYDEKLYAIDECCLQVCCSLDTSSALEYVDVFVSNVEFRDRHFYAHC